MRLVDLEDASCSYNRQFCYIRQRSWANVMYSPLFVCLSVCLFVCLSVCLSVCLVASYPRTIPLNFGDDPDRGSGFRIQNIIFHKSLSTQSLFSTCSICGSGTKWVSVWRHTQWKVLTSAYHCLTTTMESADVSMPLFDAQQWKVRTSACHCLTHNNGKCGCQHTIVWRTTMEM